MIIRREPIHCIISKVLPDNKFHIFQTKRDFQSRLEAADSLPVVTAVLPPYIFSQLQWTRSIAFFTVASSK